MIKVAVMGCGTVGTGVIKMLSENRAEIRRATGEDVRLGYALDVRPVEVPEGASYTDRFDDLMEDASLGIACETIGGVGVAYKFTKALLSRGVNVVTSNKELVATHGDELFALAASRGVQYLYEASVGGGVPIIRPIRTDLAGNRLTKVCGIVNGSTNYLLTRMEEVRLSFPAALAEAKALGYVEANPAADVEGWDARRKLAILANCAFGAKLSDCDLIPTEGIGKITERDMACARALNGAIKLIANAEKRENGWAGWVHPALLREFHPLSRVRDVFNGIMVTGDFVDEVMFYGRGAGSLPTASAILGDVIEIARGMKPMPRDGADAPAFLRADAEVGQLMVRIEAQEPGQAEAAVTAAMPEAGLTHVDGTMYALLTPARPYGELTVQLSRIAGDGIFLGIPIRVL